MRTLLSILLPFLLLAGSAAPDLNAQSGPHEPILDYNELYNAVFGQVEASSAIASNLPIADTLIEPYANFVSGGYKFLEDWDPHDIYPHGTILHPALDYNRGGGMADAHQPVVAAGAGKIVYAGWLSNTWGGVVAQQIRLRGGEQIWLFAGHLGIDGVVPHGIGEDVTPHDDIHVHSQQIVEQGEQLGLLARGNSSGTLQEVGWNSHLHWEIRHIDHNHNNVGLWPGQNVPMATYLSQVVHPAMFIEAYNSPAVRLYEGIYLAHTAFQAIQRPLETVDADPRRRSPRYDVGLHNLPDDFNPNSMVVPSGYAVTLYSEKSGNGLTRTFEHPVMDFNDIGELNRGEVSNATAADKLGFRPKSLQVVALPTSSTELPATATETPSPTLPPTATATASSTLFPVASATVTKGTTPFATSAITPTAILIVTPTTAPTTPTTRPTSTEQASYTPRPLTTPTSMPTQQETPIQSETPTQTAIFVGTPVPTSILLAPVPTVQPVKTVQPAATESFAATATRPLTVTATTSPAATPTAIPQMELTATPTLNITVTSNPTATKSATELPTQTKTPSTGPTTTNGEDIETDSQAPTIGTDIDTGTPPHNSESGTAVLPPCRQGATTCLPDPTSRISVLVPVLLNPVR